MADQTPPTARTLFGIASSTKTFTAVLFANGVSMRPDCFNWDAGLKRYLSKYRGKACLAWQVDRGPSQIIWKDGLTSVGGCSSCIGFTPPGPTHEPLGIAILVNGYWNKSKPAVVADNHGHSMLEQISAAI